VAGGGITAAAVAAREASRLSVADSNTLKDDQLESHESEIRLALFQSIHSALKPNAPLLLKKLETTCKQAAPFGSVNDGVKAWKMLVDMGKSDAQLPGEAANYDAQLLALELKPLSDDATPDEFASRVSEAIDNTFLTSRGSILPQRKLASGFYRKSPRDTELSAEQQSRR